jgi:hypothetical protein
VSLLNASVELSSSRFSGMGRQVPARAQIVPKNRGNRGSHSENTPGKPAWMSKKQQNGRAENISKIVRFETTPFEVVHCLL